jgi:hypothetical protein
MAWAGRLLVLLIGTVSFAVGLWFIGITSVLYVAISLRPKSKDAEKKTSAPGRFRKHLPLAVGLYIISAVAYLAGGTFSPIVFFMAGSIVILWPHLPVGSTTAPVEPIGGSILLRSKYAPFLWYAVAEVKASPEDFPRAASSLLGTLVIFVDEGRAYALAKCRAWSRDDAESRLISEFRASTSRRQSQAFLFPLDAKSASELFLHKLSETKIRGDLATHAASLPGLLVLHACDGRIDRASAYKISASLGPPSLPLRCTEMLNRPLVWEVLEGIGKRSKWPGPDAYSNLLNSIAATRGETVGERLDGIEGSGDSVVVRSLGGETLELSRPQLRAILSIYS